MLSPNRVGSNLAPDRRINAGSTVKLDGPVGSNFSYQCRHNTTERRIATGTSRTNHYVPVPTNGANRRHCPISDEVLIDVLPGLFVPTVFSLNDDGMNDTWTFTGIDAFPQCSVCIYDRWGELIFQASPCQKPWDGSYRGKRVSPGVYHFVKRPTPDQPDQEGILTVL